MISGVMVVDKPSGPTSHDVVQTVRRGTGVRRVGHAGTLDPLASGVLVLCLGSATRLAEYLTQHDKRYLASVRFGATTETYDAGSPPVPGRPPTFDRAALQVELSRYVGAIDQTPPAYSAVSVGGHRAYRLARTGAPVNLAPRPITIHALELVSWDPPDAVLDLHCSAGTYVRSLAHDLGQAMGSGAHLVGLVRTAVGQFRLEDAAPYDDLRTAVAEGRWSDYLIPPAEALGHMPALHLDEARVQRLIYGQSVPREAGEPEGLVRGLTPTGELVAVLSAESSDDHWKPQKVFPDVVTRG